MAQLQQEALEPESPAELIAALRETESGIRGLEVRKFLQAVDWAAMHSEESLVQGSWLDELGDHAVPLAGEGAPLVSEFCVAELAAALGLTTDSARAYLGDVVEIRYRLPRVCARLVAGRLPVWKARRIAQQTRPLPPEGAAFVDARLGSLAEKVTFAALERLVEDARTRFDPAESERRRAEAADARHFDIRLTDADASGTVSLDAILDVADAVDLEHAIRRGAEELRDLGSEESLDVRRSQAAGVLARSQLTLDLNDPDASSGSGSETRRTRARQVVLHVHLADSAVSPTASTCECGVGWLEETRAPVLAEQVRTWCGDPDTEVVVRPVTNLGEHHHTDRYTPTSRQRHAQELIDRTCVFPYCSRPARGCDCDHVRPWRDDGGGDTCSCNLAMLCRTHHRIKTHSAWHYDVLDTGTYAWTSPLGYRYLRTSDGGTVDLTVDRAPG